MGTSQLSDDQVSLVVCLKASSTDSTLVWKSMTSSSVPVGTIVAWPSAGNPSDAASWLECNGQTITQSAYPELFALVGSKVPDVRGLFLRGVGQQTIYQNNGILNGTTGTTHTSGALGAVQGDAMRNIEGLVQSGDDSYPSGVFEDLGTWGTATGGAGSERGAHFNAARVVPTSNEIRPANLAVRYLIRAKP